MTEFGNLALIDQDTGEEDGIAIPLPGVRKGEQKSLPPPASAAFLWLLLSLLGLQCAEWVAAPQSLSAGCLQKTQQWCPEGPIICSRSKCPFAALGTEEQRGPRSPCLPSVLETRVTWVTGRPS